MDENLLNGLVAGVWCVVIALCCLSLVVLYLYNQSLEIKKLKDKISKKNDEIQYYKERIDKLYDYNCDLMTRLYNKVK